MIDETFFKKWQPWILKFANSKIGRFYLTSNWSKSQKQFRFKWIDGFERFYEITPSSFVGHRCSFYACNRCVESSTTDPHSAAYCAHKRRTFRQHSVGRFYPSNHFARKLSFLLFWMPYWKGSFKMEKLVIEPRFAFPILAALSYLLPSIPLFLATVSTFQPATGSNSPVDGNMTISAAANWDAGRNATASASVSDTGTTSAIGVGDGNPSTDKVFVRAFFLFNTGGTIGDGATINATNDTKFTATTNTTAINNFDNDGNDFISVVQSRPASDSTIATGDFDQITPIPVTDAVAMTEGCATTERKDLSTMATSTAQVFVLDATGRGWIADANDTKPTGSPTSGITRLGMCEGHDILDDPFTGDGGADRYNSATFFMSDNGSSQPELSVDWTASATGGQNNLALLGVG